MRPSTNKDKGTIKQAGTPGSRTKEGWAIRDRNKAKASTSRIIIPGSEGLNNTGTATTRKTSTAEETCRETNSGDK